MGRVKNAKRNPITPTLWGSLIILDTSTFELIHSQVDVVHANAQVVPSQKVIAVLQVFIGRAWSRARTGEDLEAEGVIARRRNKAEGQLAYGHGP